MTIGPDDLPPDDATAQQLYCQCTNDTFKVVLRAGRAMIRCARGHGTVAVFDAGGFGETDPGRDMLPPGVGAGPLAQGVGGMGGGGASQLGDHGPFAAGGATGGPGGPGMGGGAGGFVTSAKPHGAVLRGGELDGQTVPVLADVTEFVYGKPGSGGDGITTGAGWVSGENMGKQALGQVYRDTGQRDGRGIRIFDLVK